MSKLEEFYLAPGEDAGEAEGVGAGVEVSL
jgi:hypothetical protein